MILADEGLNGNFVQSLRKKGLQVDWILELNPGVSDIEVINFAKKHNKILLTEDKDFGEWVFAHKVTGLTIIFLRYEKHDFEQINKFLYQLISDILDEGLKSRHQFITINKNKVRKRVI